MPFGPKIFHHTQASGVPASETTKSKKENKTPSISSNTTQLNEERFTDTASRSSATRELEEVTSKIASSKGGDEDTVNSDNPTKLFSFVNNRNWAGAVKRSKGDCMKEATTWIVEKNSDGSIRWKLLPIHQACENKAPSEVIKALIAAYPESLLLKDSGGDLPLHLACRERASKAVIAALLSTEPGAAKIKDDEGRLPLHLACRQGVAVQIVDSLIVCHYRAARSPDAYSLLPIHWACAQNASAAIVESLLRANPDSLDHKDKWGRTPSSLAEASTNPEKAEVAAALAKEPSFWATNLVEEIGNLRSRLDQSTTKEMSYNSKVDQLEVENSKLKETILDLTTRNKYSDEDVEKMNVENTEILEEVRALKKKLNDFCLIFRSMEEQRKALHEVTEKMEESLERAVEVAGDDYLEWQATIDPLKREK